MRNEEREMKAIEFNTCFHQHKEFWEFVSANLLDTEFIDWCKHNLNPTFETVKKYLMGKYCTREGLVPPRHECFACAISNREFATQCCQCAKDSYNYIPCMLFWGEELCFMGDTPYTEIKISYLQPHPDIKALSDLAKSIANLPLNPKAFYIYTDLYPGNVVRNFKGDIYIFDSVSVYSETGELIVNFHSPAGSNYSMPLLRFFGDVNEQDYAGSRFRKEV